ncbi:hypothetical protein [Turicibacter sanguinis]|uniref:hypothetical protein n=1 Tax=Turicibacter sanguinis TaxID=154288 RepID=UPI00399AE17D
MKKLSFMCLLIVSTLLLGACSNINNPKVGIAPYTLSKSDEYLLEAFGLINNSQLISFNAPKEAKALLINIYSLDENGDWQEVNFGGGISIGNERESVGTFAMTLNDNHTIDFVLNSHGFSSKVELADLDFDITVWAKAFLTEFQKIEINQEIPVAIMIFDNGSSMRNFSVSSYFEPDIFEGMNSVQAVTLTFTNKEL